MCKMSRYMIVLVLILSFMFVGVAYADDSNIPNNYLTSINPNFMVTPEQAYDWNLFKDIGGPTFSGNASWQNYLLFMEAKLRQYGVIDISKNTWSYNRWYTSEWPNNSNWSLTSDGMPIKVANYGAYSGSTGDKGTSGQLVYYNPASPPDSTEGKIVVFKTMPQPNPPFDPNYEAWFTFNDYEYLSDPETFPPIFSKVSVGDTISYDVWWQVRQTIKFINILKTGKAAGGIFVFDASYDRIAGLYTFPVPELYQVPTLILDKVAGAQVINDAKQGKTATLKLDAKVKETQTYQLIGCLPGKNYGTPNDERILLISHTDGPAISQENGALGILGIIQYFSHIPQAERPRTLLVFLDNRHYMPGQEEAYKSKDWFAIKPLEANSIVASIGMEHLGQMEYRETGEFLEPTGMVEPSFLWTTNNQLLIDMAIKAVKDNTWPRGMVQCVSKPGIHGEQQGVWYGMGKIAEKLNVPGFSTMGTQGSYWATSARINKFNKDLFCTQVATMTQLTGELMLVDLDKIQKIK